MLHNNFSIMYLLETNYKLAFYYLSFMTLFKLFFYSKQIKYLRFNNLAKVSLKIKLLKRIEKLKRIYIMSLFIIKCLIIISMCAKLDSSQHLDLAKEKQPANRLDVEKYGQTKKGLFLQKWYFNRLKNHALLSNPFRKLE